eukprot:1451101-Prymnesium_polylepis.2
MHLPSGSDAASATALMCAAAGGVESSRSMGRRRGARQGHRLTQLLGLSIPRGVHGSAVSGRFCESKLMSASIVCACGMGQGCCRSL